MLPDKLCFVDTETTGGSLRKDRIIEIGIVRVEQNKIVQTFSSLINPQIYLPEEITLLTGITKNELDQSPIFFDIKENIREILDGCIMVAHNVRFDYSFIQNEFRKLGEDFSPKHFCTVKLSRMLFPQFRHHNLDALIERYQFNCQKRHRALDDARVIWDFYNMLLSKVENQTLSDAVDRGLKRPSLPIKIDLAKLDSLPESPGVYIFYGEGGMPLYIGKSINLRKRVLSHFSSDHFSSNEMKIAQQVENIETILTAGEIGALFKESELIKKMQPLYNRKLRLKKTLWVLKKHQDEAGYNRLLLESVSRIAPEEIDQIAGVFRSKKTAKDFLIKISHSGRLCEKLLGLEKTANTCFGFKLGWCKGACIGKEKPLYYNLKLDNALRDSKIASWPFPGPILIREENQRNESGEAFLVNKWCLLGSVKFENELIDPLSNTEVNFDVDTYKILCQFLKNAKGESSIKILNQAQIDQLLGHRD